MRLQRLRQIDRLILNKVEYDNVYLLMMAERKKIDWLAVLQGFSMLLVVVGHVSLTNQPGDPSTPIATGIETVIYSFHMPLFIFISGWLFYYTCIGREKTYKDMFISKFKRLLIPFYAFTMVTMLLKMALPQLMHRVVDMEEIVNTFFFFRSNPLGEMWFIIVLFELMLLYPLYKLMTKNVVLAVIGLGCAFLISTITPEISYYNLGKAAYMLPFFVMGIICCRYELHVIIGKTWFFLIITMFFVACNICGMLPKSMEINVAVVGTLFAMSLCLIVARFIPSLFESYRDYTFQIFLMGIFFQMVIRWIYVKMGIEMLFVPLWLLSVVIGVYVPTVIARLINRYAPQKVRLCFGL